MALPTSTIVFALLTCVPFGLAIRDTASGKYAVEYPTELDGYGEPHQDLDSDSEELDEARSEEMEAIRLRIAMEEAEEEAHESRARAARAVEIAKLVDSSEVAGLGRLFDGLTLGSWTANPSVLNAKLDVVREEHSIEITVLGNGTNIQSVFIKPMYRHREEICDALEERLRDVWGSGRLAGDRRIWLNPATRQRAVFDTSSGCQLTFEQYSTVAKWLDRSQLSVVPLWAIGQSRTALMATLPTTATETAYQLAWTARGVGVGAGETQITADYRNGKVVSLFVSVEADSETQAEIAEQISLLTGKQPSEDLIWSSSPRFVLQDGSAQMFLTIGKRPD